MNINYKFTNENAKPPKQGSNGAGAFDLFSVAETVVEENEYGYIEYDTGIAMQIPENYVGLLFPRSSISTTGLILANSVGVIDSDYRGSIKARFKYIPSSKKYKVGDRVCQIMIVPIPTISFTEVETITDSIRGEEGFGSTGN